VVLGTNLQTARVQHLEIHQVHQGRIADRARYLVVESVLPRMLAKMENLGAKKTVVGLVIPTGYSFNLDGKKAMMGRTNQMKSAEIFHKPVGHE